jgi:DNA-binding protein HU-beta
MRKGELIEIVARKAHLTKKASLEAVDTFLSEIERALTKGEKVILSGFGTFRVVSVKDKDVIVPKTQQKVTVKSHRAPRFSPGRSLRKVIKG